MNPIPLNPVKMTPPVDKVEPLINWTKRNPDGTWTDYLAPAPAPNWPTYQPPPVDHNVGQVTHADYIDPLTGLLTSVPPGTTTTNPDVNSTHFLDLLGQLFLPTSTIKPATSPVTAGWNVGGSGGGGGGATGGTAPGFLDLIRPWLPLVMLVAAGYLVFSFFRK